ncbi:manganese superoxide dismutase [Chloropicon primus]|uniref:Superoxide dismutase n=2 Tax=Chloropicon primus TaxID=1764295 RepID=A0A5B8MC55_9CHLO|nr:manganese superoxide dismutase [Chloropicon primus]UPQ96897.1 manganese superoxide dismutase [Chloropicon primus]|mmetsp:Transcript_4637/g.13836  ORF Transcript_4637/g.13836 Transcript_4637/m.13836 type:complete len:230 (+) Transcript_4637:144-833(+)|eukprot:QDZ17681.1 manganese superoxide dismutase [Chloropicon primus]
MSTMRANIAKGGTMKVAKGVRGVRSVRAKASAVPLPDLPYDYGALEPYISGDIMKLHHQMHHGTYVKNFNGLLEKQADFEQKGDYASLISIQQAIKFNGGGHVNHSIFWKNMCPKSDYAPPSGALGKKIDETFGSLEALETKMSAMAAGVQGSGWGWLAYDPAKDNIFVTTTSNQDPLVTQGNYVPLLGVDVWEHAYYLQYKNKRPDYLSNFFEVVNWKDVEERYNAAT